MTIPLISIKNLVVTIADKKLVNEVDFSIHQYDRIILVGENGSGKSTLLKIIKGITEPEKGVIWKKPNIRIEYLENRNTKNLIISNKYHGSKIFLSYYYKNIRLIDNF